MTVPAFEIVIALFLAAGFSALGEIILGRRSGDVLSWNESFLVGAGCSAALLFPLSALLRGRALQAELALLTIALLFVAVWRLRRKARSEPLSHRKPWRARGPSGRERTRGAVRQLQARRPPDQVARFLLLAITLVSLLFAVLNFRYSLLWDGFQIWASKAQLLYHLGRLGPEWYPGSPLRPIAPNYPALVPLYEALLCVARGGFDFDVLKPIFVVFYASMLLSTFRAARALLSERLALAAAFLLALLPAISSGTSAGGYADMPQGVFVAGVVAAALAPREDVGGWHHPLPWLIGSLTTVKSEGTLLAAIACLAVVLPWFSEGPRHFLKRWRRETAAAAIASAFFAVRFGYLRWVHIPDPVYGPVDWFHLRRVPSLVRVDALLCGKTLLDLREWALLWPAFFFAAVVLLRHGIPAERRLALATVAGVTVYATIFLFSNMPPEIHVPNAYPRLLVHLAPAASTTILLGYDRARSLTSSRSKNG